MSHFDLVYFKSGANICPADLNNDHKLARINLSHIISLEGPFTFDYGSSDLQRKKYRKLFLLTGLVYYIHEAEAQRLTEIY